METICKIHCLNEQEESTDTEETPLVSQSWEDRWIQAAKAGDRTAFERIILEYQNKVFNLAYRYLGDLQEAEDLTQDVFLNIFRHLSNFRGESKLSTWIYQITLNHCRNRIKYLKRRYHYDTESLDDPMSTPEGEVERDVPYEGEKAEDLIYRQQLQELIRKALGRLKDLHKDVIILRDIQALSYQEISEILGLPVGTIKSRLHRARWELKEILEQMGLQRGELV